MYVYFQCCFVYVYFQSCFVYFQRRVALFCVFSEKSCSALCIFRDELICFVYFQSSLCRCITTMCWWNCSVQTVSLFSSTSCRLVPTLLFTDLFRQISLLFLVTEKKLVGGPQFHLLSTLCFKVHFIATGMKYVK